MSDIRNGSKVRVRGLAGFAKKLEEADTASEFDNAPHCVVI
jgi:hypothetical protein